MGVWDGGNVLPQALRAERTPFEGSESEEDILGVGAGWAALFTCASSVK